ncbi:hypothetical protein HK096_000380, partial [Nowakowskiella sp. JEL0078]
MAPTTSPHDANSFASTLSVVVVSSHINLSADFVLHSLHGHVDLVIKAVADLADFIVLDTSYLDVNAVSSVSSGEKLIYTLHDRHPVFGSPLEVRITPLRLGEITTIRISYKTTDKCTAVQWLQPSQTLGKKHPYLFTQCQAIHARSLIPCQDTPYVKSTYTAEIKVPAVLRALMSAIPDGEESFGEHKIFKFKQPTAIPSYLIALAVGNIHGKDVGPRTTVYCEPEKLDECIYEFAETEKFIKIGEDLLTPYVWGRYDLL